MYVQSECDNRVFSSLHLSQSSFHHADVRDDVNKNQIYTHGRFPLQQSTVDAQLQALIVVSHARPLAHSP